MGDGNLFLVRSRILTIERGHHLIDQHFNGGELREPATIEQETVDAQLDEGPHLLDYLGWRTDEGLAHLMGGSVPTQPTNLSLGRRANASSGPHPAYRGRIAAGFRACPFELANVGAIPVDAGGGN